MSKVDLRTKLKHLYKPSSKAVVAVTVPAMRFLMIDGKGDPNNSDDYTEAVEALFSVSYTAKFAVKRGTTAVDYSVMPLEGLWWADDWSAFTSAERSAWKWTMMIMQPEFASDDDIFKAVEQVRGKRPSSAIDLLRLETFDERGPVGSDAPYRPIYRRRTDYQTRAQLYRIYSQAAWQASRDLSFRYSSGGASELEDRHPTADDGQVAQRRRILKLKLLSTCLHHFAIIDFGLVGKRTSME